MKNYEYRSVEVEISLTKDETNRLWETISLYKKSWQAHEQWARENRSTYVSPAHKDVYTKVRDEIAPGLPTGLIQASRDHAFGSMKSYNSNNPGKWYEKELTLQSNIIKYNSNCVRMSVDGVLTISLAGGGKRAKTKVKINQYFDGKYDKKEWTLTTAEIGFNKKGKLFAKLIFRHEKPELRENGEIVGIDQGATNIAYTSKGEKYGSKETKRLNRRQDYNLKTVGAKVAESHSRSARRARRRIWQKNARFSTQEAHKVSKRLAEDETVKVYVLEDLTGLQQKKAPKPVNKTKRNWAPGKFAEFLEYKCASKGIEVVYVDPAYTSQTCSECGFVDKENRNSAVFRCLECGHRDHADFNASKNIRNRYVEELSSPAKEKRHKNANSKGAVRQGVCQSPDDVPRKGGQATTLG